MDDKVESNSSRPVFCLAETCTMGTLSITVPVSKIQTVTEVIADPLVQKRLLYAQDPVSGTRITLAPPPNMTPFLEASNRQLSFPPRFGENNRQIYGQRFHRQQLSDARLGLRRMQRPALWLSRLKRRMML